METEVKETGSSSTAVEPEPSTTPEPTPAAESSKEMPSTDKSTPATGEKKTIKLPASIKPPQKTGRFQARISDLVAQRDAERREKEQLRDQLTRMTTIPKKDGQPAGVKTGPVEGGETDPNASLNPEDFDSYTDYVTALVNRTIEQRTKAERSQKSEEAYIQYRQEKLNEFNDHAAPLAEAYGEGFWDAITDPNLPITEAMADAVMELGDLGPYTMLYLAANKDKALAIARMNPRAATIAIGRLASNLDYEIKHGTSAPAPAAGPESAPTPAATNSPVVPGVPKPSPVPVPRGSTPALNEAPSDKDSVDEWLKKETDRLRRINPNARFYGAR